MDIRSTSDWKLKYHPELKTSIKATKNFLDNNKNLPATVERKLQTRLKNERFAQAKIEAYVKKVRLKNPGMIIDQNKLRYVDTLSESKKDAALNKPTKDISTAYGKLDAIEDKKGFLIAALGTAGAVGLLSELTVKNPEILSELGFAAGTESANLMEVVWHFLKANPGLFAVVGAAAGITLLAKMPQIRAAWNKGDRNKAKMLEFELMANEQERKEDPAFSIIERIISSMGNVDEKLLNELNDHPEVLQTLVSVLKNVNDPSLSRNTKYNLIAKLQSVGFADPDLIAKKDLYKPMAGYNSASKEVAGLEAFGKYVSARSASDAERAKDANKAINGIYGDGKGILGRLHTAAYETDGKPKADTALDANVKALKDKIVAERGTTGSELSTIIATAEAETITSGGASVAVSTILGSANLSSITGLNTTEQTAFNQLLSIKSQIDLGVFVDNATIEATRAGLSTIADTTLNGKCIEVLEALKAYNSKMQEEKYHEKAEAIARDSVESELGIADANKHKADVETYLDGKGMTDPVARAKFIEEQYNAAVAGMSK